MSRLSEEQINEIRQKSDLASIIEKYVPLTKKGRNLFGLCPFHDDTNPSLSVSPEKQIYKCFSCGASGNVFTFLMDFEKISFIESVKKVSDIIGYQLSIDVDSPNLKNNELYKINQLAEKFFHNNINTKHGEMVKEYLKKRDIDDNLINQFKIGLALDDNSLSKFLSNKDFKRQDLLKSNLILESEKEDYDLFRSRIIFPIYDPNGKPIGFSGRAIHDNQEPKYINISENEIFKKGEILYNYHQAKEDSRMSKKIIILEGYTDVISLYAQGIKNVVATMGTAVTNHQARLIKKLNLETLIMFDGDEAGQKATNACIDELIKVGVHPKIISLENDLDPDDYIKQKGLEQLKEKMENPKNIIDFKIDYYRKNKNLDDSVEMSDFIKLMLNELTKINDPVLREITIKRISEESGLEKSFLLSQIKEPIKVTTEVLVKETKENKYTLAEKYLIYYMLKSADVIHIYKRRIKFMPTYEYRLIALEISAFYEKNKKLEVADIFTLVSKNEKLKKALEEVLKQKLADKYTVEEIEDYIDVINEYNLKFESEKLKQKLKQTKDIKEQAKIAEQIRMLKVEEE